MEKVMKTKRGITLVALVVTIIILIILAGIGTNLVLGENGIMRRAKTSQKRQDIARIYEKLEMEKGEIAIDNEYTATLSQYIEQIKKKGIIKEEDPQNKIIDDWNVELGSCYVELEGKYYFKIEQDKENEGNVKITYIENPLILELKEKVTTNAIEVKVLAINAKEYEYFIKKEGEELESKGKKKEDTYTYEGLEQDERYWIEVEVTGENGEKVRLGKWVKTITVEDLTTANTTFTYEPEGWTNGSVVATASTSVTGYTLQTSKDGMNWENTASQTYEENGVVYARIVDSTGQEGGSTTGNIDKIDKTEPVVTSATANTNTITINATDEASGIIGYAVTTTAAEPTSFTSCTNTKSLSVNVGSRQQGTTYYVWVKDEAGNVSSSKETKTTTVEGLTSSNTTFRYSPSGWTNGEVVATASTSVTGYTLQTSKDGVKWSNEVSQTYSANGTVYARLVDSTGQEGGSTTGNVDKIDKTKPVITSATANTSTITINATDEASGIVGYTVTTTTTQPTSFTGCASTKSLNVNVENQKQGTTYYVWVKDAAGNVSSSKETQTATVEGLTSSNTTFAYSPSGWTNGEVVATASTTITGYTLQTSKDGTNWESKASQTYTANGTVYARLVDSTGQEGGSTTGNVNKIDKTKPIITSATANTNTITINATDEASGMIGYTVTTTDAEPTSFTSCTNTKSLSVNVGNRQQGTTYYVWVKDEAGNISEYKQTQTTRVAGLTSANTTFSYSPNGWTNGNVVATASTTVTGYTLQTSKDGVNWSNTASQTYSANGTVYARLVDSTGQEGGSTTGNVNKIDKAAPGNATITISGSTSQGSLPVSLNASVTHTDALSGVKIGSSRYVINTIGSAIGTNASSYTGGAFSSNGQTITIRPNSAARWYLHVLTVDNAGNPKETIKGPITITARTHSHSGSSTSGGGCYTIANHHTHTDNCKAICGGTYRYVGTFDGTIHMRCDRCSETRYPDTVENGERLYNPCQRRVGGYICGIPTLSYSLGCGKTTSTIEGYTVSY